MLNALLILLPIATLGSLFIYRHVLLASHKNRWHSRPGAYAWAASIAALAPTIIFFACVTGIHLFHLYDLDSSILFVITAFTLAFGLFKAKQTFNANYRAREYVEKTIRISLIIAASITILTTIGIVMAIIFEAIQFFQIVSLWEFLTGTHWAPDDATLGNTRGMFGSIPIFAGTFMITAIAMLVAVPVGLLSAVYMSEYASERVRNTAKPALEILAGVPTVVYGFFAAITVSPLVVSFAESVGLQADFTNALTPGIVMGIMIIPFISSLSDDVIRAVPRSMRDSSLALGTTMAETVTQIVLPAALPGIIAAILLGVSRALGETMIVVMAAGLRPNLTWNPLEGMTTVTVRIVDALTGDQAFDSPETLSAFGLGLVLLVITLMLNVFSIYITRRFRKNYE